MSWFNRSGSKSDGDADSNKDSNMSTTPPTKNDLMEEPKAELVDRAKELGISGYSSMNKEELAAAVAKAEKQAAKDGTGKDAGKRGSSASSSKDEDDAQKRAAAGKPDDKMRAAAQAAVRDQMAATSADVADRAAHDLALRQQYQKDLEEENVNTLTMGEPGMTGGLPGVKGMGNRMATKAKALANDPGDEENGRDAREAAEDVDQSKAILDMPGDASIQGGGGKQIAIHRNDKDMPLHPLGSVEGNAGKSNDDGYDMASVRTSNPNPVRGGGVQDPTSAGGSNKVATSAGARKRVE